MPWQLAFRLSERATQRVVDSKLDAEGRLSSSAAASLKSELGTEIKAGFQLLGERISVVHSDMGERISVVHSDMNQRMSTMGERMGERISVVHSDMNHVKGLIVAVTAGVLLYWLLPRSGSATGVREPAEVALTLPETPLPVQPIVGQSVSPPVRTWRKWMTWAS